jgi:hypothetical protein
LVFAQHGIPEILRSDNGPQYASKEFADFAKSYMYGFEHTMSMDQFGSYCSFLHKCGCEVVEEDFILEAPGVIRPKGVDSLNWLPLFTAVGTF